MDKIDLKEDELEFLEEIYSEDAEIELDEEWIKKYLKQTNKEELC